MYKTLMLLSRLAQASLNSAIAVYLRIERAIERLTL